MPRHLAPIILACCVVWSVDAVNAEQHEFWITVLVANRAGVPAATIVKMQAEAGWVLSKAGISTTWIDCPFSTEPAEANSPCAGRLGGTRFLVRLAHDSISHHGFISDMALGVSHVTSDGGGYATVLVDRVDELARVQELVSRGQILGHAVAHEIGHLAMGLNSHSPSGLMRADWKADELRNLAERHLLFSKREGERMRIRIQSTPELKIRAYGPPALACPQVTGATSERMSPGLHFKLRERYQIVVPGAIGPLEGLNLLIDTGSIPSMVDGRVAKKLGVEVQQSEIVSFGEKSHVLRTVLPSIRLGSLHATAVQAGVGDLSFLHGVDAIIGLDVLSQSSFSIDYEARRVSFGPLVAREPTVRLEVTRPFLTVQFALAGPPVRLLVDTGSRRLVLFERRLRGRLSRMHVNGEQVLYHISGTSRLHRVFLPRLDTGATTFEHLEGYMSDAPVDGYPPEIDGVLGVRVIASKTAEFDFERGRLGFR